MHLTKSKMIKTSLPLIRPPRWAKLHTLGNQFNTIYNKLKLPSIKPTIYPKPDTTQLDGYFP